MNIFYLDPDPIIAASMHCDQHLNKMILESAQMLSNLLPSNIAPYKRTHFRHPCVKWLEESPANIAYVIRLAYELDQIRLRTTNCTNHSSIDVISFCEAHLLIRPLSDYWQVPGIFCGPPIIKLRYSHLTVEQRYQAYYLYKAKRWALDGKPRMSYKGRSVPDFLKDCEYVSQ